MGRSPFHGEVSRGLCRSYTPDHQWGPPPGPGRRRWLQLTPEPGSGGGRQPPAQRLDAGSLGGSRALSQELVNRPRTKSR